MERGLARFAQRLRQGGIRVSPGEVLDAARILATDARAGEEDFADREVLREALRLALVKRRDDFGVFDAVFDAHFAAPGGLRGGKRRRRRKGRGAHGGEARGGARQPSASPSVGQTEGKGARSRPVAPRSPLPKPRPGHPLRPLPDSPEKEVAEKAAGREGDDEGADVPPPSPEEVASALADRILSSEKEKSSEEKARARARKEKRGLPCPIVRAPTRRERRHLVRPIGERPPIERKDFRGNWSSEDERALAEAVERELLRLRIRRARRRRLSRRGVLWVQRAVRLAVGTDGVPMRLPRRRPKRREPRLLLLVDLSGSVARAAACFLALATGLCRSFGDFTAYFYVDSAVEATGMLGEVVRSRPGRAALQEAAARLPGLDLSAFSDAGRALYQIHQREAGSLRRDTLVLILGDARNNGLDPCVWALEGLRARAWRVVWLVPEPMRLWGTGDSDVRAYAPQCDLFAEVADLEGLRWGLRMALEAAPSAGGSDRARHPAKIPFTI